jgi:uncharacterized protein (DUF362 family)
MATVYLASCETYDPDVIAQHVRAGAAALGVSLPSSGSALLHAAIPLSHPRFAPDACTNPVLIEGVARSLAGAQVTIGGQSLPGFPTRYSLGHAGFGSAAHRVKAAVLPFDERPFSAALGGPAGPDGVALEISTLWQGASFRVSLPRLTGSTFLPFTGALAQGLSLLPQHTQRLVHHHLPDLLLPLSWMAAPDLIVVDAIRATHKGGEISGLSVDLGLLIIGTDPVAVDLVCAAAYGVPDEEMAFVAPPETRAGAPKRLADVKLAGTVGLEELRKRGQRIERLDPNPELYALPKKISVIRSEKSRLASCAGALTEALVVIERAGYDLSKSRQVALVLGAVDDIPPGTTDKSTVIYVGDTARGETKGYGRVVRLTGRNVAVSQILMDMPFLLDIGNLRTDLGLWFTVARVGSRLSRMFARSGGRAKAAGGPPRREGGGGKAAQSSS